jgi:hypothetical protein
VQADAGRVADGMTSAVEVHTSRKKDTGILLNGHYRQRCK